MKHISIEDFDKTIIGDDYTDTSMFDADEIVHEIEAEAENQQATKRPDTDARRRIEMLREHKALNNELADIYDEFLNS